MKVTKDPLLKTGSITCNSQKKSRRLKKSDEFQDINLTEEIDKFHKEVLKDANSDKSISIGSTPWLPDAEKIEGTRMKAFTQILRQKSGLHHKVMLNLIDQERQQEKGYKTMRSYPSQKAGLLYIKENYAKYTKKCYLEINAKKPVPLTSARFAKKSYVSNTQQNYGLVVKNNEVVFKIKADHKKNLEKETLYEPKLLLNNRYTKPPNLNTSNNTSKINTDNQKSSESYIKILEDIRIEKKKIYKDRSVDTIFFDESQVHNGSTFSLKRKLKV